MKNEIIKIVKLSIEELKNKIGKNSFDIFINILKIVIVFLSLWILFEKFKGNTALINSYPYMLWLLSGFIPMIYVLDVLVGSFKYKFDKPFEVINVSSFLFFSLLTFIEIVIFRLCGFEIDVYYFQLIIFMLLLFIFLQLCSILIVNFAKINEKINKVLYIFIFPLVCFSGLFFLKTEIHNRILRTFVNINPVYYLIQGIRDSLVFKKWSFNEPHLFAVFVIINIIIILFCFGLSLIKKKQ